MSLGLCGDYSMRQIVFLTLLALCSAELGYQYQQQGPAFGYETDAAVGNQGSQQSTDHYHDQTDYHKHFYAFEAPYDSSEEADTVEHKISANSQKNLQVVFIKAPENKAVQGALNALIKQTSEDKTAIYVLNKQTDSNELASKITAVQSQRKHKPQVHFVKYRTDAEAAHAQQHIQAQYGGATGQALQPLPSPSLGYSQQPELPQAPQGYFPPELPQQGHYPEKQAHAPPAYYPPELPSSGYSHQPELPSSGYSQQPELPSSGYSQQPELPASGYSQHVELPSTDFPQQPELPQSSLGYYPQGTSRLPPSPQPSYLPPLASYANSYQGYNQGNVEIPPLPLAQQQLAAHPYDLDARTARSRRIDFRVNERHRTDSRMVFPTETPSKRYLPAVSKSYLPAQKRRRRAHF